MAEAKQPEETPSPQRDSSGAAAAAAGKQRNSTPQRNSLPSVNQSGAPLAPSVAPTSRPAQSGRAELRLAGGRFALKTKLGGGSFGDIYKGLDLWRNREVAVKLEQAKTRHPQLNYESRVYKILHSGTHEVVGIPEVHWFGLEGEFNAMVMDLCGPCLEDLFNYCMRRFSLKTIVMLADQMMHRMEFIHRKAFVHRDIKPENFVMGLGEKGHTVMLIDFGLSKKFWDSRTKAHIPYKDGKPLTGTARYCSANTHKGIELSRRDDLESIGFLLIYFLKGALPWQGIVAGDANQKTTKIGEKKIATALEDLCRELPPQFLQYMRYARDLKFEETPNYDYCRRLFTEIADANGYQYDWVFDWITKRKSEVDPLADEIEGSSLGGGCDTTSQRTDLSEVR